MVTPRLRGDGHGGQATSPRLRNPGHPIRRGKSGTGVTACVTRSVGRRYIEPRYTHPLCWIMAILGLLEERDLHGYEIRRHCAESYLGLLANVSFGSIYPALTCSGEGGRGRGHRGAAPQVAPRPRRPSPPRPAPPAARGRAALPPAPPPPRPAAAARWYRIGPTAGRAAVRRAPDRW